MFTSPKLMLPVHTAWLILHLRLAVVRSSAPTVPPRAWRSQRHRRALGRRSMQRFKDPGLPERVVAAQKQLAVAADRVTEVLELEPVGVDRIDRDPVHASLAAELDARHGAMPGVVDEQGAFAADHLELVALGQRGAAVEHRDQVAGEAEDAGEDPVGARRPEPGLAVHPLRLAAEEPRSADGVAADIH